MLNFDLWYGNILCVKNEDSLKLIIIDPERTFWGDCMFDFANLEFAKMLDKKETGKTKKYRGRRETEVMSDFLS